MRRAQALAVPQRGRRPIPTAPLSLAGARPAAASPFRCPVLPPSLSQSRFESQDPWSRSGSEATKSNARRKARGSKTPPPRLDAEGPQSGVDSQDPWSKLESKVADSSARFTRRGTGKRRSKDKSKLAIDGLRAEVSRLLAGPKGRWSTGDRSAYDFDDEDPRVKETFRKPKPEPKPQPNIPTFLFSDLVLDLGAEGAPGVRGYDSTDQDSLRNKWSATSSPDSAARERLLKHIDDANSAKKEYQHLQETPGLSHWHIRQADVLSIALRGGPMGAPPSELSTDPSLPAVDDVTRATASLLHKNGIPKVVWGDDSTLLWWVDARENNSQPQPHDLPNFIGSKNTSLEAQIDYSELRRVISASLASGRGLVGSTHTLEKHVYSFCSNLLDRPADRNRSYSVISLVMDVEEALVMAGKHLSTRLCGVGLVNATTGLYLEPARHYLDLLIKRLAEVPADNPDIRRPLVMACVRTALQGLLDALEAAHADLNSSPSAVLGLLTGFNMGHADPSPSFSQLMSYEIIRENSFSSYVHALAKIGALRTLWRAWRSGPCWEQDPDDDNGSNSRAAWFTQALVKGRSAILAYDLKRCEPSKNPAHDFQRDCDSMPTRATWRAETLEDAAMKHPPGLTSKVANAFEMDTPDDAINVIQRLMRELPESLGNAE